MQIIYEHVFKQRLENHSKAKSKYVINQLFDKNKINAPTYYWKTYEI